MVVVVVLVDLGHWLVAVLFEVGLLVPVSGVDIDVDFDIVVVAVLGVVGVRRGVGPRVVRLVGVGVLRVVGPRVVRLVIPLRALLGVVGVSRGVGPGVVRLVGVGVLGVVVPGVEPRTNRRGNFQEARRFGAGPQRGTGGTATVAGERRSSSAADPARPESSPLQRSTCRRRRAAATRSRTRTGRHRARRHPIESRERQDRRPTARDSYMPAYR